jgi:broad specificity phosphatase PhoE
MRPPGRAQARDLGRALEGRGVELIVTSHLVRARETAEIVHAQLGGELPFVVDPRLAESHRGEWETRRFSSIVREESNTWRHYRELRSKTSHTYDEAVALEVVECIPAFIDEVRGLRDRLEARGITP